MKALRKLKEARNSFNKKYYEFLEKPQEAYSRFRERYAEKATGFLDAAVLGLYEGAVILDHYATAKLIRNTSEEGNPVVRFMIEDMGINNGLLSHAGMEHLFLSACIGATYVTKEAVEVIEKVDLEIETKTLLVYPVLTTMAYSHYFNGFCTWLY